MKLPLRDLLMMYFAKFPDEELTADVLQLKLGADVAPRLGPTLRAVREEGWLVAERDPANGQRLLYRLAPEASAVFARPLCPDAYKR